MENHLKTRLLDDLIVFGECATKTSVINGKVTIEYVDRKDHELQTIICDSIHSHHNTMMDCASILDKIVIDILRNKNKYCNRRQAIDWLKSKHLRFNA